MRFDRLTKFPGVLAATAALVTAGCQQGGGGTTTPQQVRVWAWGANTFGQIGDGTQIDRTTPVRLPMNDVRSIKAGFGFSLALATNGAVRQWGTQRRQVFGDPTPCPNPGGAPGSHFFCDLSPTTVQQLPSAELIGAGFDHGLAVVVQERAGQQERIVYRWGRNDLGQLGGFNSNPQSTPIFQVVPDRVLYVVGGGAHNLALQSGPPRLEVWTWGRNDRKQLGNTSHDTCSGIPCRFAPDTVPGLGDVIDIAAGEEHSLALNSDGTVWAWGSHDWAQLGQPGRNTASQVPVQVQTGEGGSAGPPIAPLGGVTAIAAGGRHSLALKSDGTVWAWGDNSFGQIGTSQPNLFTLQSSARKVEGLTDVTAIAGGGSFSLALKRDGTLWAWGDNRRGQLGAASADTCGTNAPCSFSPIQVATLSGVTQIAAGGSHALALTAGA